MVGVTGIPGGPDVEMMRQNAVGVEYGAADFEPAGRERAAARQNSVNTADPAREYRGRGRSTITASKPAGDRGAA